MWSLRPEQLRTLGVTAGLLGLLLTLGGSLVLGRAPDPTLTVTFGGLATVAVAAPTSREDK